MENKKLENAYNEVIEILKYIPKEDYNKIPRKLILFLEQNRNEKNTFVYNVAIDFKKQNISKEAKVILAFISEKYWKNKMDGKL